MGMGEEKLRAKQFKQKTDEVLADEVKQANLFSETLVERNLTFECIRDPIDAPVSVGDGVRLLDMRNRIEVFSGMASVGYLIPTQTEAARSTLKLQERKGRAVLGHVVDVSELTPTFVVQIIT